MALKPGRYDPLKPDIELFDFKSKKRYGLKLSGSSALQVGTISQDDTVHIRTAGKRIGDFDEQNNWKGGRGIENLSSTPNGYWDAENLWTLSEKFAYPTLLWQFSKGLRSADFFLPDNTHSLTWRDLFSTKRYFQMSFVSSGFSAAYIRLWLRKYGTPGTLTVELRDGSSVLKTATCTDADVNDVISVFHKFAFTAEALTGAATYYIRVYGDSDDNKNNHWAVGVYDGGTTGTESSDGSSFASADVDLFYYVADADIARKWMSFFLDGAMYVVDKKDDGTTASALFINGDRGKATAAAAGTLTDSTKSWVTNRWAGARVRIVRGTGAGQSRQVASNTGTVLTVSSNWTTTPDSTSQYVIYSTDWFTEITAGLGVVSSPPVVSNQIVYFPQGTATVIRRMVWNPGLPGHSFSNDGTNKADFLVVSVGADAVRIWKCLNNFDSGGVKTVAYASAPAWSAPPTNMSFTADKNVGDATYPITNMLDKDGLIYVAKEDGIFFVDTNLRITRLQSGIDKVPSDANGVAMVAHQQFIYYSWVHSLIRAYGSSHDDIGQDWSGYGLPDGREGVFSSLDSYTSLLLAGIDAGEGTSSVLAWDGLGFHEILRAFDSGQRIRMVKVQPCPNARNRLWVDVGGVLIYQEMPFLKGAPWLDSGVRYMHESVLESATIDMGTASALPKFIKELVVFCDNLGDNYIEVDYQVDDDVHTNNWTHATTLFESPESTSLLALNNVRKFAYRLRIHCVDNSNPPRLRGVTPNGYARVPYKMVWTLRCQADNISSRGRLVKPDALMRWLLDNARFPGRIQMKSQYSLAHDFFVIIHPPRMFPYKPAQNGQAEESVFTIVLEEA